MIMGFRFRQFSVSDDQASMKVGTDAVLLGAWAGRGNPANILDIGTGSGLIALMMAQRFSSGMIHAIDIHPASVTQARENFNSSAWSQRLTATQMPLQEYATQYKSRYELIVSNPPYFTDSLLPPDPSKKLARHTGTLSYREIAEGVVALMHPEGSFNLILPYENQDDFERLAAACGLKQSRQLIIVPVKGKKPNRILSEWQLSASQIISDSLAIRNADHQYSEEYKALTGEFYLAL
ncbi:MAG: methyltransferase [Bacteroidota bacterium]